MAFNPQELEIIRAGVATGKSRDQIISALSTYRTGSMANGAPSPAVQSNPMKKSVPEAILSPVLHPVETAKDFSQMVTGTGEDLFKRYENTMDAVENPNLSTGGKWTTGIGQVAGAGSDIIGNIFKGIVKMGLSQEAERSIVNYVGEKGAQISQTEAMQALKQWHDNLNPEDKAVVDASGNIAMFMADVLTLGIGGRLKQGTQMGIREGLARGARGADDTIKRPPLPPTPPPSPVLERAGTTAVRTTDAVAETGAKATSNVVEGAPSLGGAIGETVQNAFSRIPRAIAHGAESVADKAVEAEKVAALEAITPKAAEAFRVGVPEPVINSVVSGDRTTLQSLLKMVDIAEKAPSTLGQKELPAIVSGDAAVEMFKFVEADRRAVGEAIGKATEELAKQSKVVDMKPAYREIASVLKANDIVPDLKGKLRFRNLSLTEPERAAIQKLYTAATENKTLSPTQVHQMDRLFSKLERESRVVDKLETIYVKGADGQPQNIFRMFRDVFSSRLEELSPEIKRLNAQYREVKNLVDDLRDTILKTGDYNSLKGVDSAEWVANNLRRILGNAQSSPAYAAIYNKLDDAARKLGYTGARADLLQAFAVELEKLYPETVKPTSFKGNINASIPATKMGVIEKIGTKIAETGAPTTRDQQRALRELIEDRLNYGFKPEGGTPPAPTAPIVPEGGAPVAPAEAVVPEGMTPTAAITGETDNVLEEAMKVDTYPAPRSDLHKQIIKDIHKSGSWTGKGENGEDIFGGKVNQGRRLDIVIGAPAAGKSEVLANPLSKKHGSLLVDADRVKAAMPEYNGFNAAELHQESSDVVEGALLTYAFKKGDNIVLPIVGKSQSTIEKVAKLAKDAGYEVHLTLNQVPPEVAVTRAKARAAKTGRVVPEDYILNAVGNKPLQNFNEFKLRSDLFDSATAFSNDVKKGRSLDLMESDTVTFGFASPNVKVGLQYDDALQALKSPEHVDAYKKFQDIDREVGIPVATHSAIGKWADGAENTLYYRDGDITKEDLIYSMAKKGRGDGTPEGAQKQVIWFKQAEGGQDFVHDIAFKDLDPKEISKAMDELGIPYQTVANDRVIVFNKSGDYFDTEMLDKLEKLKAQFGDKVTDIKDYQGEGDFIGSWLDEDMPARQEALKVYDEIINKYEKGQ